MDTPAFTRTRYDLNAYEYDLGESVLPLNYTTDVGRFENDKRCSAFNPNVNNYTSTSDVENDPWKMGRMARVIDEESELFLLNYPLTRDPYGKYLPKAGPKLSNWVDCDPVTDKLTDYSRLNFNKLDFRDTTWLPLVLQEPIRNPQAPLHYQGYVNEYNLNQGSFTRNDAKDAYSRKQNYRKPVDLNSVASIIESDADLSNYPTDSKVVF